MKSHITAIVITFLLTCNIIQGFMNYGFLHGKLVLDSARAEDAKSVFDAVDNEK